MTDYNLFFAFRINEDGSQTVMAKEIMPLDATWDDFMTWVDQHNDPCVPMQFDALNEQTVMDSVPQAPEWGVYMWDAWNAMEVGDQATEGLGGMWTAHITEDITCETPSPTTTVPVSTTTTAPTTTTVIESVPTEQPSTTTTTEHDTCVYVPELGRFRDTVTFEYCDTQPVTPTPTASRTLAVTGFNPMTLLLVVVLLIAIGSGLLARFRTT